MLFTDLDWSPTGDEIALTRWDQNLQSDPDCPFECAPQLLQFPEVHTVGADGTGQPTGLANLAYGSEPAWAPDSSRIAFLGDDWDLRIMNADGSEQSRITTDRSLVFEHGPAWSPNGTRLVFSGWWNPTDSVGGDFDLFTIDADGSNRTNLTSAIRDIEVHPSWQPVLAPTDTTPPEVSSTSPPNNGTGVRAATNISATFSEEGSGMNPDTITDSTFKVVQVKPTGDVPVSGTVSYDETSQTATFDPSRDLAKGLYRATLTTGVADKAANALSNTYRLQFATAGPPNR